MMPPEIDLGSDLLNYIIDNKFQPGDRLPTITQLQDDDHLGISSSKIREQLEVARTLGLVEVRSKIGTRLKEYDFTPAVRLSLFFALATNPRHFEAFRQLRYTIETAFWLEACEALTRTETDEMRGYVEAARKKLSDEHWIRIPYQEHRAFHMTVFRRLENPFVQGLLEAYWDAYEAVELNRYADYSYLQKVWDYHESILNAICEEKFEEAREAFTEHTRLLRYQPRMQVMQDEKGTVDAEESH